LVGDSLGNVILGYESTIPVTMEEMLHHTRAVSRGCTRALVVGDMPFMSYQTGLEDAKMNAGRFLKEAGAEAVKLEGGVTMAEVIRAIVVWAPCPFWEHPQDHSFLQCPSGALKYPLFLSNLAVAS
jgi:3-methyl-2-oxobutanoate hydroxymethyltransferase